MDTADLIAQLCTLAGIIMEDESVGAISQDGNALERAEAIRQAGKDLTVLAAAGEIVHRRGD